MTSADGKKITCFAITIALTVALSPAAGASSSCSFEVDYVGGGNWTFVCDAGWGVVHVYARDLTESEPCIETTVIDAFTIKVDVQAMCLDDELRPLAATIGTLYVDG